MRSGGVATPIKAVRLLKPTPIAGRWRPVPGYEGLYEVSDRGQVRSLDRVAAHGSRAGGRAGTMALRGKILALAPHRSGHVAVHLSRDGVVETVQVHRLVLEAFAGACPDGQETLHGSGGPADNRWPENIRYGTRSKNTIERHIYGGMHAKLTADAVRAMRARRSQGRRAWPSRPTTG